MTIRAFDPEAEALDEEAVGQPEQEVQAPAPRKRHPRCACGCGRAACWPQERDPVFHTRLCGYRMALEMVRSSSPKGVRE